MPGADRTTPTAPREPIAIVGMACRFPGEVNSPRELWSFLLEGKNGIVDVPPTRWDTKALYDPDYARPGKLNIKQSGFIRNIDLFDAQFFGIAPVEASRMDPQQRLLLEVSYEALEDAGIRLDEIDGSRAGVFIGITGHDYFEIVTSYSERRNIGPNTNTGGYGSIASNRISYVYNLKGPSFSVDTACSSSLVALHLACRSLRSGECETAIVGGVNALLKAEPHIAFSKGRFLSPDCQCKAFDRKANGYVRSEGAGIVVLRPLSKALASSDRIYALVLGSAINQDGRTPGITVPSQEAQEAMLREAQAEAGLLPHEIQYVEAHGTGTQVGDSVEANAIGRVIGAGRIDGDVVFLGSVKTNLGHLEPASGVAGLMKLALALQHGRIPGNLHFEEPNPDIKFSEYHLEVPTRPVSWPRPTGRRCGAVNSFGFGGANAHAILQEAPAPPPNCGPSPRATRQVFMVSAQSGEALRELSQRYIEALPALPESLPEICAALRQRRTLLAQRLAIVAGSKTEVLEKLRSYLGGAESRSGLRFNAGPEAAGKLAFVFSGQGPQWFAMGRELLANQPVFQAIVERIDATLRDFGWLKEERGSLMDELGRAESESRIHETHIAQPAIFAVQVALCDLWRSLGIVPEAVVGHSIGEAAAGYASGALSLEEAARIVYWRSHCQRRLEGCGKMLAVGLSCQEATLLCARSQGKVEVATVNGPRAVTLAGNAAELASLAADLTRTQTFHRLLQVNIPFHSAATDCLREEFSRAVGSVQTSEEALPLYSTVTGDRIRGSALDVGYWFDNIRRTVQFHAAMQSMIRDGFNTFVEISPHPILAAGIEETLKELGIDGMSFPSLRRKEPEEALMLDTLARLLVRGVHRKRPSLPGPKCRHIDLPNYPWQQERHWLETPESERERLGNQLHPHIRGHKRSIRDPNDSIWDIDLDPKAEPYLAEHVIDGAIVFPAAGHVDLAWSVGRHLLGPDLAAIEGVEFEAALLLPEKDPVDVQVEVADDDGAFSIYQRARNTDQDWKRCSHGRIRRFAPAHGTSHVTSLATLRERFRFQQRLSAQEIYGDSMRGTSLRLGGSFQVLKELYLDRTGYLGRISANERIQSACHGFSVHPALLDGCIHGLVAATRVVRQDQGLYLPSRLERCRIHGTGEAFKEFWFHAEIQDVTRARILASLRMFDPRGNLLGEVSGFECKYVEGSRTDEKGASDLSYELQWQPETPGGGRPGPVEGVEGSPGSPGAWLLCGVPEGVLDLLTRRIPVDRDCTVVGSSNGHGRKPAWDFSDPRSLIDGSASRTTRGVSRIVFCCGGKYAPAEGLAESDRLASTLAGNASALLDLVRTVDEIRESRPSVCILTLGAHRVVDADDSLDVMQAPSLGLARVAMNEYPGVSVSIVDLSKRPSEADIVTLVARLPQLESGEEIAIRQGSVYVQTLRRVDAAGEVVKKRVAPSQGFHTISLRPGVLGSLALVEHPRREASPDEVEVEVKAAALNFRDVMMAMGLLGEEAVMGGMYGRRFGLECSGVVTRVGSRVQRFRAGDSVVCFAPDCLSAFAHAKEIHTFPKPSRLSHEQAAAIPLVYLTAHYALNHLCRLRRGERVLIHAGAGGVGQAAIRLAQLAGAEIFATAGDERKRDHLHGMGIERLYSSRDLSFKDRILEATGNYGVDVVLNSLTGGAMVESIACLAPYGRFVELGKRDIYGGKRINLRPFGKNLSYFAVDVDRLLAQKPDLANALTQEVLDHLEAGRLEALPVESLDMEQVGDAFARLAQAKHIGKVVLKEPGAAIEVQAAPEVCFRKDSAYLVTGGCSGFGLRVAEWLAGRGAGTVVLMGRSGLHGEEAASAVERMRSHGACVRVCNGDVTVRADVNCVLQEIAEDGRELRGVFHAAAVFDDVPLSGLTAERFLKVIKPKVLGGWNLHSATSGLELDHFVLFSSATTLYGNPGQGAYVAGNVFLEQLAVLRRLERNVGTAISLGPIADSGVIRDNGKVQGILKRQGWTPLATSRALDLLGQALSRAPVHRALLHIDWSEFARAFPQASGGSRLGALTGAGSKAQAPQERGLRETLASLSRHEGAALLQGQLQSSLAGILGLAADKIDPRTSLGNLGLDSLMATQLSNWIKSHVKVSYPVMKLMEGPSIAELTRRLMSEVETDAEKPAIVSTASQPWILRPRRKENPAIRLFCFPYTGAGASVYRTWADTLPDEYELCCIQPPGREERRQEFPAVLPEDFFPHLLEAMKPLLDRPFACYGHSMGGPMCYTLCSRIHDAFQVAPVALFVGATASPGKSNVFRDLFTMLRPHTTNPAAALPDEQLVEFLRRVGAPLDLASQVVLREVLPVVRADILLRNAIDYREVVKLPCPIYAISADGDDVYDAEAVDSWKDVTTVEFALRRITGRHLFLHDAAASATAIDWIVSKLRSRMS